MRMARGTYLQRAQLQGRARPPELVRQQCRQEGRTGYLTSRNENG
jgi:hypothetical protein